MNLKVQSITLNETRTEKSSLSAMRRAQPSEFEFLVKNEDQLTRFSSDNHGPIKPLIALDKIKSINPVILEKDLLLLLNNGQDLCMLVTVRKEQITAIEVILKEAINLNIYKKLQLITEEGLQNLAQNQSAMVLPLLTPDELLESTYQFEKKQSLIKPFQPAILLVAAIICLVLFAIFLLGDEGDEVPKEKPAVIEVKTVRTVKMDPYYGYKQYLEGKIQYSEISPPLIAATILHFKLPSGWQIEEIRSDKTSVSAQIINLNGRTGTLKHLRENSGYQEAIDIDGQSARFTFPIVARKWFGWTLKVDSFHNIRDDFMDQMILLGGVLRSNEPHYNSNHTFQDLEVSFENVSLAYLDLFNSLFANKPIFINEFKVRPILNSQEAERVNITFTASIIGR